MSDPLALITAAVAAFAAVSVIAYAALAGWRGWLDLQQRTLDAGRADPGTGSAGSRIEIADLRERVRKLEAIAAGVDL